MRRREVLVAGASVFVILFVALEIMSKLSFGALVWPFPVSCTVGITGTAANITLSGFGANLACGRVVQRYGTHVYTLSGNPQGAEMGSGSLEQDGSLSIIAVKKEEQTGLVHDLGLGKGQCHAHKTGKALAQRVIPALHMGSFSCLFSHGGMLFLRDDGSIDVQKVRKAMPLAILLRNGLPQPLACFFASVPNGIRHHLTCLTAQSDPDPRVVRLFEHKRPQFVQFQCRGSGIFWGGGEQGST
jgi:hypothetical protein